MAIILIEEVLMGLDEVKVSLEQAMTTLEVLIEDMPSHLDLNLKQVLAKEFYRPLQSRVALLDVLLDEVATMA
jgi:hypothetical protein